jgi:hypothetical protein
MKDVFSILAIDERSKRSVLFETARAYSLRVFVESGTFRGDTVDDIRYHVDRVYSFEKHEELYERARARFANDPRVAIIHADSGQAMSDVVSQLNQPALFWLDAHPGEAGTAGKYGESPLRDELRAIANGPKLPHVVMIDDARYMGVEDGWPSIAETQDIIGDRRLNVVCDIIFIEW